MAVSKDANKPERKPLAFKWSEQKEQAALLLAADELTDEAIAEKLGTGRTTLFQWRSKPEFRARIEKHQDDIRTRIRSRGIAIVENRVRALQDRWDRMHRLMNERGASTEMLNVPGGSTGLLVHNVKSIGAGPTAEKVDLYEFDAALFKEMREHEKQAAQELGQWTEKADLTSGGKSIVKVLRGVTMDDL